MYLNLAHTKLDIYKVARIFVAECFRLSKELPAEEKHSMSQQIRRAALSVILNLAEGCSRRSPVERRRFFEISRGSIIEVDTALDIIHDLEYCSKQRLDAVKEHLVRTFKILCGLIGSQS